jgi:hypothetical protein
MHCNSAKLARSLAILAILAWWSGRLAAEPPIDRLLPDTTKAFIATADLDQLVTQFGQSHLGQLWNGPALKPFVAHLRQHPDSFWARWERDAGATLGELRKVASGAAAVAIVGLEQRYATLFLFHVNGNEEQVRQLLVRVEEKLGKLGAQRSEREVHGATLSLFELPAGQRRTRIIYFRKEGILGIADDETLVAELLTRWAEAEGSLAENAAYKDVMQRCQQKVADPSPDLSWFIDPRQLANWMRRPDPELDDAEGSDESFARHGFDAMSGLGGVVHFHGDGQEIVHVTSIHAPPPYENSMRMMSFPPGSDFAPPPWIPSNVSSYMTLYIDMANAFNHCSALADELFADGVEGTFEGFLEDLRADDGPGVDVGKDLVAYLENRIDLIGWYAVPVMASSEGNIVSLRIRNEKEGAVAAALRRLFEDDPGAKASALDGHEQPLWKIGAEGPGLSSSGAIVTHGRLLLATDFEHLHQLVNCRSTPLSGEAPFQRVTDRLHQRAGSEVSLQSFSFLDRELVASYELLRLGMTDDAESLYARLILGLLSAATGAGSNPIGIDYGLLPAFDAVKPYLGTSGMLARNHPTGWLLEGIILPRADRRQEAAR